VRRIGKTAVLGAMVVALGLMTFLSFRYSRQAINEQREQRKPRFSLSEAPLEPTDIERFEPEAPPSPPEVPEEWLEQILQSQAAGEDSTGWSGSASTPPEAQAQGSSKRPSRSSRAASAPLKAHRPTPPSRGAPPGPAASSGEGDLLRALTAETPVEDTPAPKPSNPRVLSPPDLAQAQAPLEPPPSGPILREGTLVPAVLATELHSDLAGPVRAVVTRDVYDSVRLARVLIPRGTWALGRQTRQPLFGESRLLVTWHRLVFPDGSSMKLPQAPAAGADGALGLPGQVNRHWGRRLAAVGLLSLAGAGVQLSQPQRSATGFEAPDSGQLAAGELGRQLGRLSREVLRREVDLPPTITLPAGSRLSILVTRDLALPPR